MTAAGETTEALIARVAAELGNPWLEHLSAPPIPVSDYAYRGACSCGWTSPRTSSRAGARRGAGLHAAAAVKRYDRQFDQRLAAELAARWETEVGAR